MWLRNCYRDLVRCNALYTGVATDEVWGVVFDIPASKKAVLDAVEGLGYGYKDVQVVVTFPTDEQFPVQTYIADPKFISQPVFSKEQDLDHFNFQLSPGSPAHGIGATPQ